MSVVLGNGSSPGPETTKANAAGPGSSAAPMAVKLPDMFAKLSSQGGWTGAALEYLTAIRANVEDPSMPTKATMKYISDEAVAFYTENHAIVLVRESDITNPQAIIGDAKFFAARAAFNNSDIKDRTLLNVVSINRFMLNRASQMAAYISKTLLAQTNEMVKAFNIDSFGDQYQIVIDIDMANVQQFFDNHSPSGLICGNFGFLASLVDKDQRFNQYQTPQPMFGVTGYVDFKRQDASGSFVPLVHVTDILSIVESPKILALALPIIADMFITRSLWRQPFTVYGKDNLNLGNLIVDPTTSKPAEVKNEIDLRKMFREYIVKPILCIDVRVGHPSIPGLNKITRASDHTALAAEIFSFLNLQATLTSGLGHNLCKEIVGVVETAKAAKLSSLMDTRDVNYLFAVNKLGWNPRLDFLLTQNNIDPIRQFDMIRGIIDGGVVPTHSNIVTILDGDFIQQIAAVVGRKVYVIPPTSSEIPNIDLSDFISKSFQPGASVFQTGPSGFVGNGYLNW